MTDPAPAGRPLRDRGYRSYDDAMPEHAVGLEHKVIGCKTLAVQLAWAG